MTSQKLIYTREQQGRLPCLRTAVTANFRPIRAVVSNVIKNSEGDVGGRAGHTPQHRSAGLFQVDVAILLDPLTSIEHMKVWGSFA